MKAYFIRKPMTVEGVKANAAWAKAERQEPVEVTAIASVPLTPAQYAAFCKAPLKDWDFLAPYCRGISFSRHSLFVKHYIFLKNCDPSQMHTPRLMGNITIPKVRLSIPKIAALRGAIATTAIILANAMA